MYFRVLHQDPHLIAIDKPSGYHVHPPEDPTIKISASRNCLALLRKQLGQYLYPVHRLDVATSGVLLYALDPETAGQVSSAFREQRVRKIYHCVVRGWMDDESLLDRALGSERDSSIKVPAETHCLRLARVELTTPVGRYPTARYSLVQASPRTGRFHQIRRHLAGCSHPIIGDSTHGDGVHNRFFREKLEIPSLLLKCQALQLLHPRSGEELRIVSRWTGKWHRVFDLFGVCPFVSGGSGAGSA